MRNMNSLLLVLLLISSSQVKSLQLRQRTACGDGVCQEEENCATCPVDCCDDAPPTDDDSRATRAVTNVGTRGSAKWHADMLFRTQPGIALHNRC